jgi:precorrin-6A synthase
VRKLLLIGIGAGDPDHVTLQAVKALQAADVVFLFDKDDEPGALRRAIIDRHAPGARVVSAEDPPRVRGAVADWRRRRGDVVEALVRAEEGETGAFLVWGDPSLYDGMIALVEDLIARGLELEYEVIAGISAVSALAAAHRIAVNRVGGAVQITTGRRLAEGMPGDDVVVMLDGDQAFRQVTEDVDIYWGAYLGTPDELLIAGRLADVRDEITRVRAEARERKGWMFDTYLLRRVTR